MPNATRKAVPTQERAGLRFIQNMQLVTGTEPATLGLGNPSVGRTCPTPMVLHGLDLSIVGRDLMMNKSGLDYLTHTSACPRYGYTTNTQRCLTSCWHRGLSSVIPMGTQPFTVLILAEILSR